MVEIAPPPRGSPGNRTAGVSDILQQREGSDEEQSQVGGNWKVVHGEKVMRRRTTMEHGTSNLSCPNVTTQTGWV